MWVRLDAEVEAIPRRLGVVLPGELYGKALEVLAGSDDDEREN